MLPTGIWTRSLKAWCAGPREDRRIAAFNNFILYSTYFKDLGVLHLKRVYGQLVYRIMRWEKIGEEGREKRKRPMYLQ